MIEERVKVFDLAEEVGDYEEVWYQALFDKESHCPVFSVSNLNECPEDAIIGRDLFDAEDYIKAVRYGIMLAQQGYTDVEYVAVDTGAE